MSKTASEWISTRVKSDKIEADLPLAFDDLPDIEKGALLLAVYEGRGVQYFHVIQGRWLHWMDYDKGISDYKSYRIAPKRISGTVDVDADGNPDFDTWWAE